MKTKVYAEDLPYWKTSRSSESAIEQAKSAIEKAGGKVTGEGYMMIDGQAAWMLQFEIDGDTFRYTEPVIESAYGNAKAAKIQAAVSLKHAIKARCVEAMRKGARKAFIGELLLPNGHTLNEMQTPEIAKLLPRLTPGVPLLEGEIVTGD